MGIHIIAFLVLSFFAIKEKMFTRKMKKIGLEKVFTDRAFMLQAPLFFSMFHYLFASGLGFFLPVYEFVLALAYFNGFLFIANHYVVEYDGFDPLGSNNPRSLRVLFGNFNKKKLDIFISVFDESPYENDKNIKKVSKDSDLKRLALIANIFHSYIKDIEMYKSLPIQEDIWIRQNAKRENVKRELLQKQILEKEVLLRKEAPFLKLALEKQVESTKEAIDASKIKVHLPVEEHFDPTIEDLRRIIENPNVSDAVRWDAIDLERRLEEKMNQSSNNEASENENAISQLKAIKMYHKID